MEKRVTNKHQAFVNKQDITVDTLALQKAWVDRHGQSLEKLRESHQQCLQELQQKHGNDLHRVFTECAHEHPLIMEARAQRCTRLYEVHRDTQHNVQERIEMYHEVRGKKEWDKSFPNDAYPSRHCEQLIEKRQQELLEKAKDLKADQVAIHQELEHDQLVLSYMEDRTDHASFLNDYSTMLKNHMSQSTPAHEVEWKHRNPKAPEIEPD
ncbi:hypothetical protein [Owenweeksia hongkongensis]|uniref:hypothetical protein n=1 Tax=Owenweeksia hongkongensis TaxID=253245 RepID=UPI003A8F5999